MKITQFVVFVFFFFSFKSDDDNETKGAFFNCSITVQKIKNLEEESISDLHDRLKKESEGENMLNHNLRILTEKKESEEAKTKGSGNDSQDEEDDDHHEKQETKNDENDDEQEQSEEYIDPNHKIVVADLPDPESPNKIKKKLHPQIKKSVFLQEIKGYQYLTYFKCKSRGSFYHQEIDFKIDCLSSKEIEVKIFNGQKIEKKINYNFADFFINETHADDDKEQVLPEFNYSYNNPSTFIVFNPSDDECILRISSTWKLPILMLTSFLIIF